VQRDFHHAAHDLFSSKKDSPSSSCKYNLTTARANGSHVLFIGYHRSSRKYSAARESQILRYCEKIEIGKH